MFTAYKPNRITLNISQIVATESYKVTKCNNGTVFQDVDWP